MLNFVIYDEKEFVLLEDFKMLGISSGIVKRLAESIPKDSKHVVYANRYFKGIACAEYLLKNNIFLQRL